ncbi:MAG: acyl--CoA ligase [Betaproteobacteria bacterium]|nr:acyl--CoA ligase [Betaproteobacteria bacterium]
MALGLTRDQIGITDAMIGAYGEAIFRMSHNHQVRQGDPVRALDWAEIERQREAMGLADAQIAERLGLTREQVMLIRNTEESRRFRLGQQAYLIGLGGAKRFRTEHVVPFEDRFRFSGDALYLRAALRFDGMRVAEFAARGWWRADTLPQWLARHAGERPEAPALVHAGKSVSWQDLAARVAGFAAGLIRAGIQRGDVVAVQLPNLPEFIVAYLAICRLGAVMTTIHMPYRGVEFEALLRHSRARAIVCLGQSKDWSPAATALALRGSVPALHTVLAYGAPQHGALAYAEVEVTPASGLRDLAGPAAADPFLLLYTSGTSAAPKAVPHSYHTLLSNARLGVPEHGIGPQDRVLSAAPFSHLFGLYSLHVCWAAGATAVLLPVFTPSDLAQTIARDKPTALWTAPAHIAACRAAGLFEQHDFSSLKLAIMSGSACPPELVRWTAARLPGCAVTQLWGMTETQAALYTRPGDPLDVAAGSAGRPSPGTEVRVVSPGDENCAAGEEGELQVRGCLVFAGFYDHAVANDTAFAPDGWYRTGDLAVMDGAGNVTITGRSKDVINRGGFKFNPRDVEDLLDAHPKVLQSAIAPMPDPVLGERACCFVTLRPGHTGVTLEELVAFLAGHGIAKVKFPERLVVLPEMPLTPTRKVIKGRLKIPD